jgi:hypothetical protein
MGIGEKENGGEALKAPNGRSRKREKIPQRPFSFENSRCGRLTCSEVI